ncbi:MAG: ATP-dependent Clp protease proteolytic subunit [Prevotellaceae bacterium]|nr:ATP-dependent Clp protease proteolytic subunit [Candidatus Faecinaster equi]
MDELMVAIPECAANLQLPSPELRNYYRDAENRIFCIDEQIDENILELSKEIIRINRDDKNIPPEERMPIKILLDTPGGDVSATWSLIKLIEISKTPVWTINLCSAYSAGADILASGHKRFAMPGTSVLVHSGSCYYGGTQEQAESMKKFGDKLVKKVTDYFLSHTKVDPKAFKKKAPTDWYLDEDEALAQGIIDAIITDLDEIF